MRAMSEYMTECEARAVARWDVELCLRMVFESLHSWSISYGGWDLIPNLGGTPTKVSCYSRNIEQLLTGRAQGSRGLIRKQKWT